MFCEMQAGTISYYFERRGKLVISPYPGGKSNFHNEQIRFDKQMPHFADPKFQQIMSGRVSEHLHLVTVKTRRLHPDSLSASFGTGKPESPNEKIKKLMKSPLNQHLKSGPIPEFC